MVQDRAILTTADQYKVVLWSIDRYHFQWPLRPVFQGHANIRRWLSSVPV